MNTWNLDMVCSLHKGLGSKFKKFCTFAFLLLAFNVAGGQPAPEVTVKKTSSLFDLAIPKEEDARAIVGDGIYDFPFDSEDAVVILDRVFDGFQAGQSYLTTDDGYRIMWGFKYQEAVFQSIAVVDKSDRLLLIGSVTDVVTLAHDSSSVISSIQEYRAVIKRILANPATVTLFVRPGIDLSEATSLVKRWLQADLMGFNKGCSDERYRPACALLPSIDIPITAYSVTKNSVNSNLYDLNVVELPNVLARDILLENFKQ